MKRISAILSSLLLWASCLYAVPAKPGIGLEGDEFYHYRTDSVSPNISYKEHAQRAMRARAQAASRVQMLDSNFPTKGDVRSLVLLVSFKDIPFQTSKERFHAQLNEEGYTGNNCSGSARDYFLASSMNQFRPTFDVYGPFELSHDCSYYGGNNSQGSDKNATGMVREACQIAANAGVDFSQYDYNNDGIVDNIFIFYAGYSEAEGANENTIWPHSFSVQGLTLNGKRVEKYACTAELLGTSGTNMCGIGTFCHEFSHVLGLPDMYHTKNSGTYTVGQWDLMASGSYNGPGRSGKTPITYSAFERFMMGWLVPEQITEAKDYILEPIVTSNKAYLLANTTHNLNPKSMEPTEFWLIENRQHVGIEANTNSFPGSGLMIAHIQHSASRWNDNTYNNSTPLCYDICEAYNTHATQSSASDLYPGTENVTEFVPTLQNGSTYEALAINNIQYISPTDISFHLGEEVDNGLTISPRKLSTIHTMILDSKSTYEAPRMTLHVHDAKDTICYVASSSKEFELSKDSLTWVRDTLWYPLALGSTIEEHFYIRHRTSRTCFTRTGVLKARTRNNLQYAQLALTGYAERPILIDTVRTMPPTQITPYSMNCRWEAQEDAEVYYLTVTELSDGAGTETQDFEDFKSMSSIEEQGWQANFVRTTSSTHSDGKNAIVMANAGDELLSPRYISPIYQLSIWIAQNYSSITDDNYGQLLIEGLTRSGEWHKIAQMRVTSSTKSHRYTYDLDTTLAISQIRFRNIESEGSGGIVLDAFSAETVETIHHIYSGKSCPVYATKDSSTVSITVYGLTPNTRVCYQVTCKEEKGCEVHTSPISAPEWAVTRAGTSDPGNQLSIEWLQQGILRVNFSVPAEGTETIHLFDGMGQHMLSENTQPNTIDHVIDMRSLPQGHIYIITYTIGNKMGRKDHWAKVLY